MKIQLTEKELKNIIFEETQRLLNYIFREYDYSNRDLKYINEGLIMTFEPNKIKHIIERKYDLSTMGARVVIYDRTTPNHPIKQQINNKTIVSTKDYNKLAEIYIAFEKYGLTKVNPSILKDIIKTFDVCGWMFTSMQDMVCYNEYKNIEECDHTKKFVPYKMYFRPKFDQVVNNNGVPNYCYHITPSRLVNKIVQQGLKPKNYGRTSNHTERVFLYYKYPQNWKNEIANNFRESRENEKYTLLKVNIGKWIKDSEKRNNRPKFQFDSLTMSDDYPAIYTFETIPPQYISIF